MTRISAENICKNFDIDFKKGDPVLAKILNFFTVKREKQERLVLKNISFSVSTGEVLGIIGRNGAGKSTLLKIIAGIYQPAQGKVKLNGELVYLTSLGLGLMPKLTMKENIFLSGAIMGLDQKEIRQRFSQIVEFSGLSEFVDAKIYQFSTGMTARLAFSATFFCIKHKNPDILLIDEVFGAGADADFEEKAAEKMEEMIRGGAAVIMASHNLELIKRYCNKAMWLDNGAVIKMGAPDKVVEEYIWNTKNLSA